MKLQSIFENKILTVALIGIINSVPIIWDHYHGGVPTHYLLHSKDMPGFSNWWGLLTIPLLTWIVLTLITKRKNNRSPQSQARTDSAVLNGFLISLGYGMLISVLWQFGLENILQYLILLPVLISLFRPAYWPEHLLGFVLGMAITFGGILPIIIGIVLMLLSFITYKLVRNGILFLVAKIR